MTTPDIIDTIDELVDGQLAGGEPETDPRCGHCQRHWHGLPITQRIAHMYTHGTYDEAYVAAEDDSPVLCRGSDFIGPMQDGWSVRYARAGALAELDVPFASAAQARALCPESEGHHDRVWFCATCRAIEKRLRPTVDDPAVRALIEEADLTITVRR